jgi:NAD(P)-dependent dehydrogenase (short-subunit alcohol dehydrogenase family)
VSKNEVTMNLTFQNSVAVVTGAGGAIGGAIACALAKEDARVAILDICEMAAQKRADEINANGGKAAGFACNVVERAEVESATREIMVKFGAIDILINGAGGSRKETTTSPDLPFFDITPDNLMSTVGLNFAGTVIPSQVVGRIFAEKKRGVILNIASIGGVRPLTRAVGYAAAKAAVVNFTQWLAVHMAREYSPQIRVNALAPGFVLTEQNRFLLTDEKTGAPTERGRQVIAQVPMSRYGQPEEMVGAALWLVSGAASYVTGAVIPVDGGILASLGV